MILLIYDLTMYDVRLKFVLQNKLPSMVIL